MNSPFRDQAEVDEAKEQQKLDEFTDRISAEINRVGPEVVKGKYEYQEAASDWLEELEEFIDDWHIRQPIEKFPTISAIDAVNAFVAEHPSSNGYARFAVARIRKLLSN